MDAYKVGVRVALDDGITAGLTKIVASLLKADEAAAALKVSLAEMAAIMPKFGNMAEGVSGLARAMSGLATSAAEVAAAMREIRMGGAGGGGGGARGGKGGGMSVFGFTPQQIAGQAAAFAGYEGLKGAMTMDDTIARAMIAMGMPVGPDYMKNAVAKQMRSAIFAATTGFGVAQGDTQEAALQAMRALAPLSADQRVKLLPSILNFSGAEALGKHGTSMLEAAEAAIGLAHQLRDYTPEQMEPVFKAFAKLSMASPASLSQMGRAGSYYLPLLNGALGMDPAELLALGTVGSQMGLNTKSGTWLANMFSAPFVSDLTSKRQSARLSALDDLQLVKNGKPVTKDAFEFLEILAQARQALPNDRFMRDVIAAFGKEGGRAASIYTDPAVLNNVRELSKGLKTAPTPDQLQSQYGQSDLVKFHKLQESLMRELTELGESVLPAVNYGMRVLGGILKGLEGYFSNVFHPTTPTERGTLSGSLDWWKHKLGIGQQAAVPQASSGTPVQVNTVLRVDKYTLGKATSDFLTGGMGGPIKQTQASDFGMSYRPN